MLTKTNKGKYLSREWHEQRQRAFVCREQFSDSELAFLEAEDAPVVSEQAARTFEVELRPVDSASEKNLKIDIRAKPEVGDKSEAS